MAHIALIEDKQGDLVDLEYYCSDFCAKDSDYYNGWYGAVELYTPETCNSCGVVLGYVEDK